ncbi:MAG TPA: hypothetical protein VK866_19295 [Acidimicrobiales bacterium]|nr:hypothetical protein [Acidimicrobiales bacterium]
MRLTTGLGGLAVVGGGLGAMAYSQVRPTPAERSMALPGDDLVDATVTATLAITIGAPAERVWPWVAQLGQDRGGFYSYTRLENLMGCRITNADRVVPEWQARAVGESVPLHPDMALEVAEFDPPRALVLRSPDPGSDESAADVPFASSWAFLVDGRADGTTRLLTRERYAAERPAVAAAVRALVIGSTIMGRRMLLGIRDRAEAR